MTVLSYTR